MSPEPVQPAATGALSRGGVGNPVKRNYIGKFHTATATWSLRLQRPGWVDDDSPTDMTFGYGNPGDTPLVGDWDGNGSETQGVWRAGTWLLSNTLGGGADIMFGYGNVDDVPLVGDWDGDGVTTPGVFRQGTFFLRNSNTTGVGDISFNFGLPGDIPLAGDWDGDGIDTVGVYRPSTATFYLINANQPNRSPDVITAFGNYGALPIIGDWDGNGLPTLGVWQSGGFFLLNSIVSNGAAILGADIYVQYGDAGDIPIAGNWNMNATNGLAPVPPELTNFFPLGVDFQPSSCFAKWQGRGINTVMRIPGGPYEGWADYCSHPNTPNPVIPETITTWNAEAVRLHLQMIRGPQANPHADDNNPYLLAWDLDDEPEARAVDPMALLSTYNTLKGVKASRAVLFNFTGNFILDLANGYCRGPGAYPDAPTDCYPNYIQAEDWTSVDYYPVNERVPLARLGAAIDSLTRWSWNKVHHRPTRVQLAYVEASLHGGLPYNGQPLAPAPPTADQFRAEVWLAIIHGARGIIYFPHNGCGACTNPDAAPADVIAEMTNQNARITSLASVLQTQINPPTLGFRAPAPLEATWRQSGGSTYLIVLNMSTASTSRTMTLFGLTPTHPLTVVGENRSVGSAGSASFTDGFGPYGVHIYQY